MSARHQQLPHGRLWQYLGLVDPRYNAADRDSVRRYQIEKCCERMARDVVEKFITLDQMPDGTLDVSLTVVVLEVQEYRGLIDEAFRAGQADGMRMIRDVNRFPAWESKDTDANPFQSSPTPATKGNP